MIILDDIYKSFDDHQVLRGVNLSVAPGESVVIIGRSGCGKSVLLKHIVRLLTPDRGNVMVDGQDILTLRPNELNNMRRKIGVLFQSGALFDSMTVGENIGFCLKESMRKKPEEIKKIVEEKLQLVGLDDISEKMPSEISGGMKKRVALARAIASQPDVLLYDEPTTGLDPISADHVNEMIVNVNRRLGVTSIAVTHDMVSAAKIADRIVMLHDGRIIWEGTPEAIGQTDNQIVRQFISGTSDGMEKNN